ncbi:hypothetical protein C9374_010912 [Naegleria lovaniensis]|uniref:Uncharacterized protein n=1 Tax=Naegleria lovaniensis TaxID=51637 RepID=A0AA88GAV7_NAELO|nr:uncharacterized protein C9374_010912 [Naegleria lovaniensis]KAG2374342.1 hypothetical protein C9374_010912 [Naegleria lovaniensis]
MTHSSQQILTFSSLPPEMVIEIAKFLPLQLVLSNYFLIPLKYLLGIEVYSIEAMENGKTQGEDMGQDGWMNQQSMHHRDVEIYWREFLTHHVMKQFQSLSPMFGPIAILSRILKYTLKYTTRQLPYMYRNDNIEQEICTLLCVPDQFKYVFLDKLKIIPKNILQRKKPQPSNRMKKKEMAISEFKTKRWSITELQFLLSFVERNSFIFILANEINEKQKPIVLKTLRGGVDVELVYCNRPLMNHAQCNLSMYLSNKFNFEQPMKIRGTATIKDGVFDMKNIRYTPLEEQTVTKQLSEQWYPKISSFERAMFSSVERSSTKSAEDVVRHAIILQHYWYPGTEIEIPIVKINYLKSGVLNDVSLYLNDTPRIVKALDTHFRIDFNSADSVEKVIVELNPRTSVKKCKIFPQKIPFPVIHASMIAAITYFALSNSCLLNWRYSRQFYNSNNFSYKGIILFSILDLFNFVGYPFKALISYLWGCFKEQHVTMIESLCNFGYIRYFLWTIVSALKSYYRYHEVEIPLTSKLSDKGSIKLCKTD